MTSRTWTVREVIDWSAKDFAAREITTPRLDAELLVARALDTDRVGLYLDLDRPLVDAERASIRALVARRREREPVAYIVGYRDFYGRRFLVDRSVLVPRPDTETLVEEALRQIPEHETSRILDIGTGSGAIGITLAAERPLSHVVGTDVSAEALEVAARNAEALGVSDRVRLQRADLIPAEADDFDLVVSNPPYISKSELDALEPEVRDHEPSIALAGGQDGLNVVRKLYLAVQEITSPGVHLLVEVGLGQASTALRLGAETNAWAPVGTHRDLNGIDRVVHLRRI